MITDTTLTGINLTDSTGALLGHVRHNGKIGATTVYDASAYLPAQAVFLLCGSHHLTTGSAIDAILDCLETAL